MLRDVDNVGDIMEDINQSIEMASEVADAMSNPIGPPMDEVGHSDCCMFVLV